MRTKKSVSTEDSDINKEGVKPKHPGGRPKGSKKRKVQVAKAINKNSILTNEVVTEDKLFLFIKKTSIPSSELDRFLQLCDKCILSLGPDTLSDSDIEEIALIYRDRVYMDMAYEVFAQAGAIDASMVSQIEKINKSLEVRKTNLGARFIDRDKTRKQGNENSFLELFSYFIEAKDIELQKAKDLQDELELNKSNFTNPIEYMENKLKNKSVLIPDEDK